MQFTNTEKNQEYFLNLENQWGAQNTIKKNLLLIIRKLQTRHILECLKEFYKTLFMKRKQKTVA